MTIIEFAGKLAQLRQRLDALVRADSVAGQTIDGWLVEGARRYAAGDIPLACACAAQVQFVLEDMDRVQALRPAVYRLLRNALRKIGQANDYFGIRQEIRTARSLVDKGVHFTKSEAPDYVVGNGDLADQFGIECTSCRLEAAAQPKSDVAYKVSSALAAKTRKSYSVQALIVEIDVTNLIATGLSTALNDPDVRTSALQSVLDTSRFDSMILSSSATEEETSPASTRVEIHSAYVRVDRTSGIAPQCLAYLDTFFPLGKWDRTVRVFRNV